MSRPLESCPDCGARLPNLGPHAPTHRYMGGSPSCWSQFINLHNGGDPPVGPSELGALLLDAYCVQHHGIPSPQSINSVAVHGLVLYAVLERQFPVDQALSVWLKAPLDQQGRRHQRFEWLTPPDQLGCLTVADIVEESTAEHRAAKLDEYVRGVWHVWKAAHEQAFAAWFDEFVAR